MMKLNPSQWYPETGQEEKSTNCISTWNCEGCFSFCDGDQTLDQIAQRGVLTLRPWEYSKHYWTWL